MGSTVQMMRAVHLFRRQSSVQAKDIDGKSTSNFKRTRDKRLSLKNLKQTTDFKDAARKDATKLPPIDNADPSNKSQELRRRKKRRSTSVLVKLSFLPEIDGASVASSTSKKDRIEAGFPPRKSSHSKSECLKLPHLHTSRPSFKRHPSVRTLITQKPSSHTEESRSDESISKTSLLEEQKQVARNISLSPLVSRRKSYRIGKGWALLRRHTSSGLFWIRLRKHKVR